VVAGDGKAEALGGKGKAADGPRMVERPLAAICKANHRLPADREGNRAIRAGGDLIDPFLRALGNALHSTVRVGQRDQSIIAAGEQSLAVEGPRGGEDRARVDGDGGSGLAADEPNRT